MDMSLIDFFDNIGLTDLVDNIKDKAENVTDAVKYKAMDVEILCEGISDATKDLKKDMKTAKEDAEELFTTGFFEMVVKDNNNYIVSSEKRDRANKLIACSKNKYDDAINDLKDKESHLRVEFEQYISNSINPAVNIVNQWIDCTQKLKSIDFSEISNTLKPQFRSLEFSEIDNYIRSRKTNTNCRNMDNTYPKYHSTEPELMLSGLLQPLAAVSLMSWFNKIKRVEASGRFYLEAKEFVETVNIDIEKIRLSELKIKKVEYAIKELTSMIRTLKKNLEIILPELERLTCADANVSSGRYSTLEISYLMVVAILNILKVKIIDHNDEIISLETNFCVDLERVKQLFN